MLHLISDKDWTCKGMFQNLNKFIILYRTNKCTLVIKTFIFAFSSGKHLFGLINLTTQFGFVDKTTQIPSNIPSHFYFHKVLG